MNVPGVRELAVATRQVATKSALNPILWICGLTTPLSLTVACFVAPPVQFAFFALGALPVLYGIRAFDHFMKKDPDRLQSERFLIERQVVGKIGFNTDDGTIIVPTAEAADIENPLQIEGRSDA